MPGASILHRDRDVEPHSTSKSRPARPPCSEIQILLLEDEPALRFGLAGLLGDDGHEVFAYACPDELADAGRHVGVSVVITDYDMPKEDGLTFADRFHAARPDAPIILVTAYATLALDAEVQLRPFLTVLSKPVEYDRLHALVHALVP
jgi:DNA-binding NtrC family response regulator